MVENIAKSIIDYSKSYHRCTSIGIYGAWGEGKTSVLNLVQDRLLANGKNDKISIVHFSPWLAGNNEVLMREFFKSIVKDYPKEIRRLVRKYADLVALGTMVVPQFGPLVSAGIAGIKRALDSCEDTLLEQKQKITKAIINSKRHLLVFIDDLDRLDKEELHTVFRLIRQVADFDNTIYVVAMDVEMASKSIAQYYGQGSVEDGRRFIDKIIQVPIALPVIQKPFLVNFLQQSLQSLFEDYAPQEQKEAENIAVRVAELFETKRDCIRYLNQLKFVFPAVCNEVNNVDLCLLEAIKVISQEAYVKIFQHKNALLMKPEKLEAALTKDEELKTTLRERFEHALKEITEDLTSRNIGARVEKLLRNTLFSSRYIRHGSPDYLVLIDKQSLRSEVYFDKFFVQAVPERLIPDADIKSLSDNLLSLDHQELAQWIDEKGARFSYEEIQRAIVKIVRNPVDRRNEAAKLLSQALSISGFAKGYSSSVYNGNRCDVFIATYLMPNYMLLTTEETASYNYSWRIDVRGVDDTLAVIFTEAELSYSMALLFGIIKRMEMRAVDLVSSFSVLKNRFVALTIPEQMEYHSELLMVFYSSWHQIDAQAKFDYLAGQIENAEFPCEQFIEKFVFYKGDATDISSFLGVFRDIMPLIEERVKTEGVNVTPTSSLGLVLANYKENV